MGAWDTGPFDNDGAVDWSYGLAERKDLSLIEEAIAQVVQTGEAYLDSDVAVEAIAAIDVLARLLGRPGATNAYTETADQWVRSVKLAPGADLIGRAGEALARIQREPSELLQLWAESDSFGAWRRSLADLAARLTAN